MKHNNKIARLDVTTRSQVICLRQGGMYPAQIAERLGLLKTSELNAIREICAEPGLRRYQRGIETVGEGKTRSYKRGAAP